MNGREAFFKLKKININCKVIISSGFTNNENMDELKESGLLGFIQKPYSLSKLSQLIAEALKQIPN